VEESIFEVGELEMIPEPLELVAALSSQRRVSGVCV
jgi:hypothetical protein